MKLTNKQLEILVSMFMKKVNNKKEAFFKTKKYKELVKKVEKSDSYTKAYNAQQEHSLLLEQSQLIQERMREIRSNFNEQIKGSLPLYTSMTKESLDRYKEIKVNDLLKNRFPTEQDIEEAIVMKNINGSGDILKELSEEFKI